jgi:GNAT superfamily N-acetyltransferase
MASTDTYDTPYGALTLRPARPDEVEIALAIEEDATSWVRSRGIDPGRAPRPLREIFAEAAADGHLYLAWRGDAAAGKLAISTAEEALWSELPGAALYVHGLMVRRAFAGQEVGRVLLGWAEQRAAHLGLPLVRLDCDATNPALCSYYARAGFTHRGDVTLATHRAARFEKRVEEEEEVTHAPESR